MHFLLGAIPIAAMCVAARALPAQTSDTLRVLVVVDDTGARPSFVRGIRFGAEEAARTGALFGTRVALTILSRLSLDSAAADSQLQAASSNPALLIASGTEASCIPAIRLSARRGIPLLDAGCPVADSARGHATYSIVLSAHRGESVAEDGQRLELWSATLDRFGGEQLNERFRRRYAVRMDSPAWTGWIAMKVALDLALRSRGTSASSLLRQLADPRMQFDGQKGRPLYFDQATRRLIQPAYRVVGSGDSERVVAEVAP